MTCPPGCWPAWTSLSGAGDPGPQGKAAAGGPGGTRSALAAGWGGPGSGDQAGPPQHHPAGAALARLGLGRQLQPGRLVAEQLRPGPAEGPGEQVAVEVAGLLVVVTHRLTMASRLSVPGRLSPLRAAWRRSSATSRVRD
jgi:hypothetical protein